MRCGVKPAALRRTPPTGSQCPATEGVVNLFFPRTVRCVVQARYTNNTAALICGFFARNRHHRKRGCSPDLAAMPRFLLTAGCSVTLPASAHPLGLAQPQICHTVARTVSVLFSLRSHRSLIRPVALRAIWPACRSADLHITARMFKPPPFFCVQRAEPHSAFCFWVDARQAVPVGGVFQTSGFPTAFGFIHSLRMQKVVCGETFTAGFCGIVFPSAGEILLGCKGRPPP